MSYVRMIGLSKAQACYEAIGTQILFIEQSIERIKTQRQTRYQEDSVQRALVEVELAYAEIILKMLRNLQEGKTTAQ